MIGSTGTGLASRTDGRSGWQRCSLLVGSLLLGVTSIPAVVFVAIILSFIPYDIAYGPQAALIAECFPA